MSALRDDVMTFQTDLISSPQGMIPGSTLKCIFLGPALLTHFTMASRILILWIARHQFH